MTAMLHALGVDCLVVFGGVLALVAVLRFARVVLDALPLSRARRDLVGRLRPIAGATLVAVYIVVATRWLLASGDSHEWLAFAAVAAVLAAASWSAIRDGIEGVYLRASATISVGDRIEVAGVRGRLKRLGGRSITIETTDGELAIIPYRTVGSSTVRREPVDERSAFHVFRLPLPDTRTIAEVKRTVLEATLLCHWSSTRRPPVVTATTDGQLEITVFPVDMNHVAEVERVVRRALA